MIDPFLSGSVSRDVALIRDRVAHLTPIDEGESSETTWNHADLVRLFGLLGVWLGEGSRGLDGSSVDSSLWDELGGCELWIEADLIGVCVAVWRRLWVWDAARWLRPRQVWGRTLEAQRGCFFRRLWSRQSISNLPLSVPCWTTGLRSVDWGLCSWFWSRVAVPFGLVKTPIF